MKSFFALFLLSYLLIGCQETAGEILSTPAPPATPAGDPAATTPPPTATESPTPTIPPDPTATPDPFYTGTNGYPWWNDKVFYEVFVRSFQDSDGDGIGDINGLIARLDYLNDGDPTTNDDLGVTGIWLMPITASPSYHGYDVTDYLQVNSEYGTNEDFKRLVDEAHARGMHVIVDLVLNHTSNEHPWFIESQDPQSEKRDWYIWAADNPGFRGPDGQAVWHPGPNGYYYGIFWSGMPDLNYETPAVTEAMYARAQFWLEEMGVDGFRLDAIKHMVEEDQIQENSFATHDWLAEFYDFYKGVNPDALTVGEAWTSTQQVLAYTGDEVDIAFQFFLAEDMLNGAFSGIPAAYYPTHQEVYDAFPRNQYATFLTNHDQNRVMSQLQEDAGKARLAASILLAGTGVPFVYYGEEIGMTGMKPDEDIRLPMQWNGDGPGVGFTTGTPWRPAAEDFPQRNVAGQTSDPASLLNHYRALIHLRHEHVALRVGEWTQIETNSNRIYAFLRHTDDEIILVVMNFNRNPVSAADYSLETDAGLFAGPVTAVSLYGPEVTAAPEIDAAGNFSGYIPLADIPPESTHIILLGQD